MGRTEMGSDVNTSITEQLSEWVVKAQYDDVPEIAIDRVKERVIDTLGVQIAGMSVSTGQIMTRWVQSQEAKDDCTVVGTRLKSSASLTTLANTTAGHALEFDDIATFSGHYANPMTAAALAVGEKLGASGRDVILAWLIGYQVVAQTAKPTLDGVRNTLLSRGWFNQGFQPALGVAALTAKLLGLDVTQTRMALGNAAATMSGMLKNRGSDTKSFSAGNAAMHGVMAAELVALGFTANDDILDGDLGVARLLGLEVGDPEKVLIDLGTWDMATKGSSLRLHASCAAGAWSQDALQRILRGRPTDPSDIEAIDVHIPGFLMEMMPYHDPQTGLEGKYSLEYDMAAIALNMKAGFHEYSDEAVRSPASREMVSRVRYIPVEVTSVADLGSTVVVTLRTGEKLEATVSTSHGRPEDPLTEAELLGKFHECAETLLPETQRELVVDLCQRLDTLADVRELTGALGSPKR